ncbi:MAG: inositol monophosphatase family protein [Candidatus Spechtbacterales bacterium]
MKWVSYHPLIFEIKDILIKCSNVLNSLSNGEKIFSAGSSFGSLSKDTELVADKVLSGVVTESLLSRAECLNVGRISIEGTPDIFVSGGNDRFWWCVDPLDGSLNYKMRQNTTGLPFAAVITVLEKVRGAKFSDVIAAGVIDLRNGDMWLASRLVKGKYYTLVNGHRAESSRCTELDIGSNIVIGEMYYPSNRQIVSGIFKNKKGWLRNTGSAAYEMALVASGTAVLFLCNSQKQHELGAAYALVKGSGGVVVDFDGNDVANREFLFNAQTPVLVAANNKIAEQVLAKLKVLRAPGLR